MVEQDLAPQWLQAYPCKTKTSQPKEKPKVIDTDDPLEFGNACENLSWNRFAPTPHCSETNCTAERAVRSVIEGTLAVLLQSGLDEKWWADSVDCYCSLRNVQDLLSDGKTLYERRFESTISWANNSFVDR